jgi:hypothetical protein
MRSVGEHIVARKEDLETRSVDGELVLLDLRSQTYLSLNRAGALLWPMMEAGTERAALVDALRATYELPEEVAARDVGALLSQLTEAGLVEVEGRSGPTDD